MICEFTFNYTDWQCEVFFRNEDKKIEISFNLWRFSRETLQVVWIFGFATKSWKVCDFILMHFSCIFIQVCRIGGRHSYISNKSEFAMFAGWSLRDQTGCECGRNHCHFHDFGSFFILDFARKWSERSGATIAALVV